MTTFTAISQDQAGGPEVLREVQVPRPKPGPTDVLVKVHAAGINPTDWKTRQLNFWGFELPFTTGWDVSGVVVEAGFGVTAHRVGDEVLGMLAYPHGHGAYAEYVVAPSRTFVAKPANVDHVHAAGLPLAGLTAWQALVDAADVQPGQRVLIHAAAGGVGHLAVQIAKLKGAHVIGTASAAKHDFLRELGADEVIDYRSTDFTEVLSDVDVVLDTLGEDIGARSLSVLRRGGVLVTILPGSISKESYAKAAELGIRAESALVEVDHTTMRELARLLGDGSLKVHVDQTFPLSEVAKAHELGETGRTTGKLVLTVDQAE
ncbi:NADP-dependent oxidoreductase [Pseudonocardiaceae bacterium YIM PH 21723]|nr:NADP-dependent oxidoreductase [Pseudonocardiaceae bacterium YIM PH 21723]